MRANGAVWLLTFPNHDGTVNIHRVSGAGAPPTADVFTPTVLTGATELTRALADAGPVVRIRNGDIWDSLATGVIRQVIRAGQARLLHLRLCESHGERLRTPAGQVYLFPTPDTVLGLSDKVFAELGLAFKREPLRAAARAATAHGAEWLRLPPAELLAELQKIERVGPWTAGAVVADVSNDFSHYPYADLAVRTWATKLAPETEWPSDEIVFARRWRQAGRDQLGALTALTLARGAHA
jgi:DNA-3-methyladenine glycosylase II